MSTPRDHGTRFVKPRARQLVADRLRRHQHRRRRRVEAAQEGVAPRQRQPDAGVHVLGKARVIGGGEGDAVRQAVARAPPSRAVPRSRGGSRRARTASACAAAARRGTATAGSRDRSGRAACGSGRARTPRPRGRRRCSSLAHGLEGAHHAVDLRPPGVGDDGDAQSGYSAAMRDGRRQPRQHRRRAARPPRPSARCAGGRRNPRPARCSFRPSRRRCSRGCRRWSRISAWWMWPQTTPSTPRRRASSATASSKWAMNCTAFLTLCLR